jgi:hypothetical protein
VLLRPHFVHRRRFRVSNVRALLLAAWAGLVVGCVGPWLESDPAEAPCKPHRVSAPAKHAERRDLEPAEPQPSGPRRPPTTDGLSQANSETRSLYAAAKTRELARLPGVILAQGSRLTLLRGVRRIVMETIPPSYHALKAVDHVPLGIHALLSRADGHLDLDTSNALLVLRARIEEATHALGTADLTEAQVARLRKTLMQCDAFLRGVLARGSMAHASLLSFDRQIAPLLLENARDATRGQLDLVHAATARFRAEFSEVEWSHVYVVVTGPHMARDRQVVMQYFGALFHETHAEGGRVIYAENVSDESKALDLVATHLVDADVGEAFFGDPFRMHRDLLSDAATEYIPILLGRRGATE